MSDTGLTPEERRALAELADELIAATDDDAYWFGPVRETSLEIRRRVTGWLDHPGT